MNRADLNETCGGTAMEDRRRPKYLTDEELDSIYRLPTPQREAAFVAMVLSKVQKG